MNQRRYRVFHVLGALITFFVSTVCGYFGVLAVRQVFTTTLPDKVPIFLLGVVLLGVSIFQALVFFFATFGHYCVVVDDLRLRVEIGIGPVVRRRTFDLITIEAILVADNGRGRPCVGILAAKPMRFGSFLRRDTILEAVSWLQASTGTTDGLEEIPATK